MLTRSLKKLFKKPVVLCLLGLSFLLRPALSPALEVTLQKSLDRAYITKILTEEDSGNWEKASQAFVGDSIFDRTNPDALFAQARLAFHNQSATKAYTLFEEALKRGGFTISLKQKRQGFLKQLLYHLKRYAQLSSLYKTIPAYSYSKADYFFLIDSLYRLGNFDLADSYSEKAISLYAGDEKLYLPNLSVHPTLAVISLYKQQSTNFAPLPSPFFLQNAILQTPSPTVAALLLQTYKRLYGSSSLFYKIVSSAGPVDVLTSKDFGTLIKETRQNLSILSALLLYLDNSNLIAFHNFLKTTKQTFTIDRNGDSIADGSIRIANDKFTELFDNPSQEETSYLRAHYSGSSPTLLKIHYKKSLFTINTPFFPAVKSIEMRDYKGSSKLWLRNTASLQSLALYSYRLNPSLPFPYLDFSSKKPIVLSEKTLLPDIYRVEEMSPKGNKTKLYLFDQGQVQRIILFNEKTGKPEAIYYLSNGQVMRGERDLLGNGNFNFIDLYKNGKWIGSEYKQDHSDSPSYVERWSPYMIKGWSNNMSEKFNAYLVYYPAPLNALYKKSGGKPVSADAFLLPEKDQ